MIKEKLYMIINKKQNILYVICAYAFFWILLLLLGGTMLWLGIMDGPLLGIVTILGSWTPTMALFVLFKRLYPKSSIKAFYINAFRERINWKLVLATGAMQLLIFVASVGIVSLTKGLSFSSMFNFSFQTIATGFIISLLSGATGEESGWRGFLQPSVEKSFSLIKSSLIVGVIWTFWHTPLWFLSSGYSGIKLVQYIVAFLISNLSVSVLIGISYHRCKNLFVPMYIHFLFNFFIKVFTGDFLDMMTWFAALYAVAAVGYTLWFQRYNRLGAPAK